MDELGNDTDRTPAFVARARVRYGARTRHLDDGVSHFIWVQSTLRMHAHLSFLP